MTSNFPPLLAMGANSKPQTALLDTSAAAGYIGVEPGTLEVWRCVKRHGIPYIKVGRLVKYRQSDLDAWLEARTVDGDI